MRSPSRDLNAAKIVEQRRAVGAQHHRRQARVAQVAPEGRTTRGRRIHVRYPVLAGREVVVVPKAVIGKPAAANQGRPARGGGYLLVIDEADRATALQKALERREPALLEPCVQKRDAGAVERQARHACGAHATTSAGRLALNERTAASSVAIVPSDSRAPSALASRRSSASSRTLSAAGARRTRRRFGRPVGVIRDTFP